MIHKTWWMALLVAVLAVAMLAACGDDDDDDDEGSESDDVAAVEEVAEMIATSTPDDIDYFVEHTTPALLSLVGFESEEDCRANAAECVGDPSEVESIEGTEIDGDIATTTVNTPDGPLTLGLIREDDVWKVDSFEFGVVEIPEGVTPIAVTAVEYGFNVEDDIEDGNVAFTMTNEGEEGHELIIMKTNDEFNLDLFLAPSEEDEGEGEGEGDEGGEEELPPGVDAFFGPAIAGPGDSANVVPDGELESGSYLMICFFEAPDGEAHASKGMYHEFEVP